MGIKLEVLEQILITLLKTGETENKKEEQKSDHYGVDRAFSFNSVPI